MHDANEVIKGLEIHLKPNSRCEGCPYPNNGMCGDQLLADALATLKNYERILHLAKAMHTWIFLNTVDEFAVYDELGFTDEDNALLGSIGRPITIKIKGEDDCGDD